MNNNVIIIGAGPAGIFTALEMLKKGSNKKITIFRENFGYIYLNIVGIVLSVNGL